MRIPPTVKFRRMRVSGALESGIQKRISKLEKYCPSLIATRVLIEPRRSREHGSNRYHVRIHLTLPNEDLAISHDASLRAGARALAIQRIRRQDESEPSHKLLNVTIRDAFDSARRRLQDYARRQRPQSRKTRAAR